MDKDSPCFEGARPGSGAGHQARATMKIMANMICSYFRFLSV